MLQLINDCKKGKTKAQLQLYMEFAPLLRGICRRYMKDIEEAEDLLQEVFLKIFTNISSFKGQGSFEGWMKRITINTALKILEKKGRIQRNKDIESMPVTDQQDEIEDDLVFKILDKSLLSQEEIMNAIDHLNDDYKVIFNLFMIEKYKHQEIAEMLGIKENTSKSKLLRAKKMLRTSLLEIIKSKEINITFN